MSNLTQVTLVAGVPQDSGTVSTVDALMAQLATNIATLHTDLATLHTDMAALTALQPALNGDGGVPAHIANFPTTQPVSIATAPALVAGTALIGKVGIDQTTPGTTNKVSIGTDGLINGTSYETVAASQTDQVMGATGATGDYLSGVLVIPASTSPGAVSIKDGSGSAITIFAGGASSLSNLVPFFVPFGAKCTSSSWKVTTGASVSAVGVGAFT